MPTAMRCWTKRANDGHAYTTCDGNQKSKSKPTKPKRSVTARRTIRRNPGGYPKTHRMPNGDLHTGATHTASSRLVKRRVLVDADSGQEIMPGVSIGTKTNDVASLLGFKTDAEISSMYASPPMYESEDEDEVETTIGYDGAPVYESDEESDEETTPRRKAGRIRFPRLNTFGEHIREELPDGTFELKYKQYFTDTLPGKATQVYGREVSYGRESIGDLLGILATDAQGNPYIERDDAPETFPSKEDFYPVDEGDLQTIGERETGFSRAQLNALDPAELFGMLAPELRLKVLNPTETGVEVGERDRQFERHLDAVEERVNKTALIRDSKGDYSKSADAVERYRTHPGVRQLAERRRINLDEMSAQEIKKLMSARNKKLKAAEKTRRRERAYHERWQHTYD